MSSKPPFEVLLPEALMQGGVPELRLAARFLSLLAESGLQSQDLEVSPGVFLLKTALVNSPAPGIKKFLKVVSGAKQLDAFADQVNTMLFPNGSVGSKGSLCCTIQGIFTEFQISERGGDAQINWQIVRLTGPAA